MSTSPRSWQPLLPLGATLLLALFAAFAPAKPVASWQWLDIAAEGGTALMAGVWAWLVLGSRPGGRVTLWLAGGLAAIMLGATADCLDELFVVSAATLPLRWIESVLSPAGMAALTWGLLLWRQEQAALSEQLQRRERVFRDHRAYDRVTQLADADYLRRQIELERAAQPGRPCAVAVLELAHWAEIERTHGRAEADRVLQAVAHQLLLNLPPRELLCRYAGARFVLLMPQAELGTARRRAQHLVGMVEAMRFSPRDAEHPLALAMRSAVALGDDDAQALLTRLNRELEALDLAGARPARAAS
ncbi:MULTISPECIES: diguanylate cyclase domain-containing protein [unclassified Rubrivivax]|uniref:GGDEF domain-containing protein n=1 Tax=unclassified Rubrivivax TaxID=2649762 RepID=UPI001E42BB96|nr:MULTISPECIES: diguanylate cyclase [unclassified Rubrivivax]MCC9597773.1 GGDEF domain-containing protein [Rubrivivax sp. JA1055]MCC9645970.1 GGDEF domain-containing protein [Rubrivivax sp. JA1029]